MLYIDSVWSKTFETGRLVNEGVETSLDAARTSVPIAFRITMVMKMGETASGSKGCRTHWRSRGRTSV